MPLLKDIKTTLNKISMQAEKSNLQFEKTINSIKTSIKNIKDVKLNIETLKISNDEYNKTLQKSQANSTKLLKQIDNYLENPTQEEKLKLKNQINVSDNYLIKAKNIFSENKTFADKVVDSFKKYKNGDFTINAEESIKLNSRLKPSFTKLINYFSKLKAETQAKTKIQTRKVYSSESPTPHPNCQKFRDKLEKETRERTKTEEEIASDKLSLAVKSNLYEKLAAEFTEQGDIEKGYFDNCENIIRDHYQSQHVYRDCLRQVQNDNDNDILTKLNLDLKEAIKEDDKEKIRYTKAEIELSTGRINANWDALTKAIVDIGSRTIESTRAEQLTLHVAKKEWEKKRKEDFSLLVENNFPISELTRKIEDNKKLLILSNVIIDRFEKWIKKNCPS